MLPLVGILETRTSSQKRKRAAHLGPERRRPQVLDAALELFLERGYEGTSMAAVADAAGVTKPVVYACFAGKDELFRALLRREEERILREIQSAFADADLSDPEATLIEGFTGFFRAVAASPDVYKLIFLGEGGGNTAVARRIQRGRSRRQRPPAPRRDCPAARQRDRGPGRVGREAAALPAGRLDAGDARQGAGAARCCRSVRGLSLGIESDR
jgi:AcrR family transcriptional regulator